MNKKIRVLHVLGNTNLGGAESRIMDLYRHINRDKIQFDFMVHTTEKGFFVDEIRALGGNIYSVPRFRIYNYFSYKHAWKAFFKEHKEFAVVQGHITSSASVYLPIAKRAGKCTTIAHARSAGVDKGIKGVLTRLMRRNLKDKADYLFACSKDAAISVFGEAAYNDGRVKIIYNAIECDKFRFNEEMRNKIRDELSLSDKFVIGHVGSFRYAKNHRLLIEVFNEIKKRCDAVLILLGEGALQEEIKELVETRGLGDSVLFLNNKQDVYNYYSAMDYFVYPSHYEGMPGTVVEAQSNGLMTLMSDSICNEVIATELVRTMSLFESPAAWAEAVLRDKEVCDKEFDNDALRPKSVHEYTEIMKEAGFDVKAEADMLERFYLCNA